MKKTQAPIRSRKEQFKKKHKKDFHWKEQRKNPFHLETPPSVLRFRALVTIGILSLLATIGILLYHPFFRISSVSVDGLLRIDETAFVDTIYATLQGNKWLIIPRDNYFFLNTDETVEIVAHRFLLEDISILSTFPHTMSIVVHEKVSTIIYDNGTTYSYMGMDGKIVEEVRKVGEDEWFFEYETTTSTAEDGTVMTNQEVIRSWHVPQHQRIHAEMGEYPIIYDTQAEAGEYRFTPEIIETIIAMERFLSDTFGMTTRYILISDNNSATYITHLGSTIHIHSNKPASLFQKRLQDIAYTIDVTEKQEIDLRFGDRIYVR